MKTLFRAFLLLWAASLAAPAQAAPLVATLEDGSTVTLGDYPAGRPTLIKFWATWCTTCRAEMPELQALYNQHKDAVNFIIVNVGYNDSEARIKAFQAQNGYDFPYVFDGQAKLSRALHVFGTPTHIFLDADGHVVRRQNEIDDTLRRLVRDAGADVGAAHTTLDGRKLNLDGPVYLYFFTHWCETYLMQTDAEAAKRCAGATKAMNRLQADVGVDVKIIGIASSLSAGVDGVRAFVGKHDIRYPVIFDANGALFEAYGVMDFPLSVLIGPDGVEVVRTVGVIEDAPVWLPR